MYNESTFKFFLNHTLSNKYLHLFMILLEYIGFVFPSCYQAGIKLRYYNSSTESFINSTPNVSYLLLIQSLHSAKNIAFSIIGFSFVLIVLLGYFLIVLFGISKNKCLFIPFAILINFVDLYTFRYFSLFPLDYLIWLFTGFYRNNTLASNCISLLFALLFVIFIITSYYYIDNNVVIIKISNPLLVDKVRSYPYDHLSSDYQKVLLLLKALIVLEFNYIQHSLMINSVIIYYNVLMLFTSVFLFYRYTLLNVFFKFNYSLFYVNIETNYLRNVISSFNFFLCLLTLILYNENIFVILIIAFNFTLLFIYLQHKYLFSYALVGKDISYELLLLMILPDAKKNSIFFQYNHMLDSSYIKHTNSCQITNCNLCNNYSKDFQQNIHLFYKYLKKETKSTDSIFEKIVNLFYYKMTNQSIKMFRFYYGLVYKYKRKNRSLVRTLKTIVENWLIKENIDQEILIDSILEVNQLEHNLADFLFNYNEFVNDNYKLQKSEVVIKLSNDITDIINNCRGLSSKYVHLHDQTQLESNYKNITGAITYAMHLLRFIIETQINQEIVNMPFINLDNLDEYLKLHFDNDKLMICSLDLRMPQHQHTVKVVKVTGELCKKSNNIQYLCDFFPKEVRANGLELFFKQINSKELKEKIFLFPFLIKGIICNIHYSFHIIPTLQKKCIMFFGHYSKKKTKTILLHFNPFQGINIVAFGKDFLDLIQFKQKWIQCLKNINCYLSFNTVFKRVTELHQDNIIECELDYEMFLKRIEPIFTELSSLESFTSNPKNHGYLEYAMETLKSYIGYSLIIHLEKQIEFSKEYLLYSIKVKNKYNSSIFPTEKGTQVIVEQKGNLLDNYIGNTLQSSTCSGEISVYSSHFTNSNKTSQYQMLSSSLRGQISNNIRVLSFFSIIMIIFNIILIFLSLIFLYTQIDNSNHLTILNELYFKFKSIQICFSNIVILLIASACFADAPFSNSCTNYYSRYSDKFIKQNALGEEYSIITYIANELKVQTIYSLTVLNDFKGYLYSSKNMKFISFFEEKIDFYNIEENSIDPSSTETISIKSKETFEDCMRFYINTILLLANSNFLYEPTPLYFIQFENNVFYFHYLPSSLSVNQKELYIGLINYINFYESFQSGEIAIKDEFLVQIKFNSQLNQSFMIMIALINLCLFAFCITNIKLAYRLYKVLILNVIQQIDKGDNISKLNKKISVLSTLVKLYDKNPNDLIKKVKHNHTPLFPQEKQNAKKQSQTPLPTPNITHFSLGKSFFMSLLGKQIKLLVLMFIVYYIVVIVFDILISQHYNQLSAVFEYISLQFSFENGVFSNLALTGLARVTNISSSDLSSLIGFNNTEEGIITTLIKDNLDDMKSILDYYRLNTSTFPPMACSSNYTCQEIFASYSDPFFFQVENMTKLNYAEVSEASCKAFNPILLTDFFFLRADIVDRTQKLINSINLSSYESVLSFFKKNELYEAYTILIFLFRPLTFNFRRDMMIPLISSNFTTYMVLIGIYLIVNIILELIIFVVVKWVIIKKLNYIQENLFLFNNCINKF